MGGPEISITIRRRREEDIPALTAIRNLPRVRRGTLAIPFTSIGTMRSRAKAANGVISLVACAGDLVVGEASILPGDAPHRAHAASLGIMVHDDWHHSGIGSALFAAVIELADNWLRLQRLELMVYADNLPAIALYRKFGFVVEGREVADSFRAGGFVDGLAMARLHGVLPPRGAWAAAPPPPAAPIAPICLRASEAEDVEGIAAMLAQPELAQPALLAPYAPVAGSLPLAAPPDAMARSILAEAAGGIVGICVLQPGRGRRAHAAEIRLIAVHPAWQGRGIGAALLSSVIEIADDWLNLSRLQLTVVADNAPALALCRRSGFAPEVTMRAYAFGAGGFVDALRLARSSRK